MSYHGRHAAPPENGFRGALVVTALVTTLVGVLTWVFADAGSTASPSPVVASVSATPLPVLVRAKVAPKPKPIPPVTVRVLTFNMLGCGLTKPGYASCEQRFGPTWSYLVDSDTSIAGFQEVEGGQMAMFRSRVNAASSGWAMYPSAPTSDWNAILWRTSEWHLLKAIEYSVPYFGGSYNDEHAVLLEHKNGRKVWVMNVHNAPITAPNYQWAQSTDRSVEAAQFATLLESKVPVILLGDTNDTTNATLCALKAKASSAHSIFGPADCRNPGAVNNQNMDKILGSDRVDFTRIVEDWGVQHAKISDHGAVSAVATISDAAR